VAEGLDFMLLTPPWDEHDTWLTAAELTQRCQEAAPTGLALGWSLETPKCPIAEPEGEISGNAHTHGHGWAVGLSDLAAGSAFFTTGPNYPIIQEIHRQGGMVGCAHPARVFLRQGRLSAGWATELPFDFLSGAGYDAMDVLGPAADDPATAERVWWELLNMGYRVAATANAGGRAGDDLSPGRFRTYVHVPGEFTWRGLIEGFSRGACVASSGPFVLFDIDGEGPGRECPANGATRRATLRAWSGALPDEHLVAVQVVRNGEMVQAWNLASQNLRAWEGSFEVRENRFAWYAVRVISSTGDPDGTLAQRLARGLAVTSPIYFLPPGFARPAPAIARYHVRVTDTADRDVPCKVIARMNGQQVGSLDLPVGHTIIEFPAGAQLTFGAPGFAPEKRSAFRGSPVGDYCRDLTMAHLSQNASDVWRDMQRLLNRIDLTVRLFRLYDFSNEPARSPRRAPETHMVHSAPPARPAGS